MANAIKRNAHEHERFRRLCIGFAQGLHRVDMRMRLGLLQDPAVIDRQIAKEVAAHEAARRAAQAPTVKTKEEMEAEEAMTEKEKEEVRRRLAARKPRIRPLSEAKAIEMGANFAAETFIFMVGISVILFENWRQRRKAKNQRDDIREDVQALEQQLKEMKAELEALRAQAHPPTMSEKLMAYWKREVEGSKSTEESKTITKPKPLSTLQPSSAPSAVAEQNEQEAEKR